MLDPDHPLCTLARCVWPSGWGPLSKVDKAPTKVSSKQSKVGRRNDHDNDTRAMHFQMSDVISQRPAALSDVLVNSISETANFLVLHPASRTHVLKYGVTRGWGGPSPSGKWQKTQHSRASCQNHPEERRSSKATAERQQFDDMSFTSWVAPLQDQERSTPLKPFKLILYVCSGVEIDPPLAA